MSTTTLYGLNNCDTCRKARNWLERKGITHQFIDYRENRIPAELLKSWGRQLGWDQLVNRGSKTWRDLPQARKSPETDPEWTLLIKEHPAIVKRPVVAMADGRVSVGFNDRLFAGLFAEAKQLRTSPSGDRD